MKITNSTVLKRLTPWKGQRTHQLIPLNLKFLKQSPQTPAVRAPQAPVSGGYNPNN